MESAKPIYNQKCVSCHGADGAGNTAQGKELKVRDLRSPEAQKQLDAKLLEILSKGVKKMPGYEKSLGAEKCKELVAYTRELAKK